MNQNFDFNRKLLADFVKQVRLSRGMDRRSFAHLLGCMEQHVRCIEGDYDPDADEIPADVFFQIVNSANVPTDLVTVVLHHIGLASDSPALLNSPDQIAINLRSGQYRRI